MTTFHLKTALEVAAEFVARVPAPKFEGLKDLLIVKPLEQKWGVVFMAETAEGLTVHEGARIDDSDAHDAFLGVVVATGRGDRVAKIRCKACGADSQRIIDKLGGGRPGVAGKGFGKCGAYLPLHACRCDSREFEVTGYDYLPFETKRGDVIVMPRRPTAPGGEFELVLDGEKYVAFFEEQFAYSVVEAA